MAFWQETLDTLGAVLWLVPLYMAAAAALYSFVPAERTHVRTAVSVFGLSVVGSLIGMAMAKHGVKTGFAFEAVDGAALFLRWVAITNLAAVLMFGVVLRAVRMEPPQIAQDLLLALAYIGIGIMILTQTGVDVRGIVATSAVITAVIGFSLQDSLGNIMGGLALQMERTIRAGDWIRVDDIEGKVKTIRWRQTSVETRNWDTVVIPNSVLMKTKVTLLGRRGGSPQQRRQWVYFRVGLDHSPTKVIHAVEAALHGDGNRAIAPEPKAHCLLTDFKDGEAIYAVRYWLTDLSKGDPTDSHVRTRVYSALRRAGIPLAIPTRAITMTEEDESGRERRHREELERRTEALGKQEFFQTLTDEEQRALAPRLMTAHFMKGEPMTRQGEQAHWLYIIAEGEAEVDVAVNGKSQRVATLQAGNLFGEMGLMTGEPRTATVTAATEVVCYRLAKEAFEDVLRSRPEIAEQISAFLARRRVELDAVRDQLGLDARGERIKTLQGTLLRGIKEFFVLR